MKKIVLPFLCVLLIVVCSVQAKANELEKENIVDAKNDVFYKNDKIENISNINGDGMYIANELISKGDIEGDLLSATLYKTVNYGNVLGNIRAVCGSFYNYGTVEKNIMVASGEINIKGNSNILGNAYFFGNIVNINGNIEKDIYIYANNINISSEINGRLVINCRKNLKIENINNIKGIMVHKGLSPIKELENNENYTFINIENANNVIYNFKNILSEIIIILLLGIIFAIVFKKYVYNKKSIKKIVIKGVVSSLLLSAILVVSVVSFIFSFYYKIPIFVIVFSSLAFTTILTFVVAMINSMILIGKIFRIKNHPIYTFILGMVLYYFVVTSLFFLGAYLSEMSLLATVIAVAFRVITIILGIGNIFNSLQSKDLCKAMP